MNQKLRKALISVFQNFKSMCVQCMCHLTPCPHSSWRSVKFYLMVVSLHHPQVQPHSEFTSLLITGLSITMSYCKSPTALHHPAAVTIQRQTPSPHTAILPFLHSCWASHYTFYSQISSSFSQSINTSFPRLPPHPRTHMELAVSMILTPSPLPIFWVLLEKNHKYREDASYHKAKVKAS